VNELCDETRFKKSIQAEVAEARLAAGDGLFTAKNEEVNWSIAHRILMPAFGPVSIQGMFDEMYDVLTQMALK
jgi:cytochrome P450/NADPH-cytochrome P450 reductase